MSNSRFEMIHISKLRMNEFNVRKFEANMTPQRQARFDELVASITAVGILEPLVVRQCGVEFEIIAGERRYRAAKIIADAATGGPDLVPCMIRVATDVEAFDLMVIENLQRDDLTPFETAMAFQLYFDKHGRSVDSVADLSLRTGIPVHAIRRLVRLLELPPEIVKAWRDGDITQTHAELLTRVGDAVTAAELLARCLRSKLSTRELAERIGATACDLERGFFDKTECLSCPDNTSVQSGLFSDITPGGKCSNPGCFEEKQAGYFTANWPNSKPAQMFGTCGFRFGHRLGPDYRWMLEHQESADRCKSCEAFISVLRLTGAVVSGYSRTCIGPRTCFDELYSKKQEPVITVDEPVEQLEPDAIDKQTALPPAAAEKKKSEVPPIQAKAPAKKTEPLTDSGPVYDFSRGERARKAFILRRLQSADSGILSQRLLMLALAQQSLAARMALSTYGVPGTTGVKLAEAIFEIHADSLPEAMHDAAVSAVMSGADSLPEVWQFAADRFGVDIPHEWDLCEAYLTGLNKSEIIRIGEEPGVGVWVDPAAVAYRQDKYKGKALMALKKEELIDIVLNSGATLVGRVPAEVIGKRNG
jgi:ParB family transcriptional regulator, chromosome partitioning protein